MTRFLISDLHLSDKRPDLLRAFVSVSDEILASYSPCQLYILGDFFEAYIGDDFQPNWIQDLDAQLQKLTFGGVDTYFIAGNRDFLVGDEWFERTGVKSLPEQTIISVGEAEIMLTHGDEYCVDDEAYQSFREMVRQPAWQQQVLSMPLDQRIELAQKLRDDSKSMSADKSLSIMDVNLQAIDQALPVGTSLLIHGHTHRPNLHQNKPTPRLVLGDWDTKIWLAILSDSGIVQASLEANAEIKPIDQWPIVHQLAFK